MESEKPYVPPAGMAEMFEWVTVTHFIVIALGVAGAVAILWWGHHVHRSWKEIRAEREAAEHTTQEDDAER